MTTKKACPVFAVADLLGKKWTLPLLQQIEMNGSKGFNELMRQMKKISPKILTDRLKALEAWQIIEKETIGKDPARTVYEITAKGEELQQVLASFRKWSEKYEEELQGCSQRECITCKRY